MADRFVTIPSHQHRCPLRCTGIQGCQDASGGSIYHHIGFLRTIKPLHLLQTVLHEQLRFMKIVQPFCFRKIPEKHIFPEIIFKYILPFMSRHMPWVIIPFPVSVQILINIFFQADLSCSIRRKTGESYLQKIPVLCK